MASFILPNGKPGLQEAASHPKSISDRTREQFRQYLLLLVRQVLWTMQEQSAVLPQVLTHATDLVPITPGCWRWFQRWRESHGCDELGDRGRIGWSQSQPLADGVLVDPDSAGQCASRLDLGA